MTGTGRQHQLTVVEVGDDASAWEAAGFCVVNGTVQLGRTTVRLTGTGGRFLGWSLDEVDTDIDGIPTADAPARSRRTLPAHPNGITTIDHIVVVTGDGDRTVAAFQAAGLSVSGGRSTDSYGFPARQTFLWAGDVIVELIGPDAGEPTTDDPVTVFGLALVADDLDATRSVLGALMGEAKPAVQADRMIATLRHEAAGISLPIAVMSPHVRR